MMAKEAKAPRMDVGGPTIAAETPRLIAKLEAMAPEPEPAKDDLLTPAQRNAEMQTRENQRLATLNMNPREVLAEGRRQARIERAGRFAEGTRQRQLLEIEARALANRFHHFGSGTAPEVIGLIDAFVADLDADIQAAVEEASI
jgi:hypothetical protein